MQWNIKEGAHKIICLISGLDWSEPSIWWINREATEQVDRYMIWQECLCRVPMLYGKTVSE